MVNVAKFCLNIYWLTFTLLGSLNDFISGFHIKLQLMLFWDLITSSNQIMTNIHEYKYPDNRNSGLSRVYSV